MDPKQNSNQPLDPKLQEVYDRVMGVNTNGDVVPPTPAANPAPADPTQPTTPVPADPTPMPPAASAMPADVLIPQMTPMPTAAPIDVPLPTTPMPADPTMPTQAPMDTPATPLPAEPVVPELPVQPNPVPPVPTPATDPMPADPTLSPTQPPVTPDTAPTPDSMNANLNMPQMSHHEETVKIGMGGSPVGVVTKPKGKGISPLILIFGAFAFLAVYAVFWVKFFGYSLPFLPK